MEGRKGQFVWMEKTSITQDVPMTLVKEKCKTKKSQLQAVVGS